MKEPKPIPQITVEEDEEIEIKPTRQNDLGRQKQTHAFLLNVGRMFVEALIKYSGLVLVGLLFGLFYWVIKKENFANEGHITQLFELIQTATLLVLGYMFGERRCK